MPTTTHAVLPRIAQARRHNAKVAARRATRRARAARIAARIILTGGVAVEGWTLVNNGTIIMHHPAGDRTYTHGIEAAVNQAYADVDAACAVVNAAIEEFNAMIAPLSIHGSPYHLAA